MVKVLVGLGLIVCFFGSAAQELGFVSSSEPFFGLGMLIGAIGIGTLLIQPPVEGSAKVRLCYRLTISCFLVAFAAAFTHNFFDAGAWATNVVKVAGPAFLLGGLITMYMSSREA